MRQIHFRRDLTILVLGCMALHVYSFGASEHDNAISNSRHRHFRIVGIGQRQFRGHAGAKQPERAVANFGLHLRLARHDCVVLRRG
jgi:hypothetical protein